MARLALGGGQAKETLPQAPRPEHPFPLGSRDGLPSPWGYARSGVPPWPAAPEVRVGRDWGEGLSLCPPPQPEVNHVPLEGPVLQAPGRSLFGLSAVLTVGSSRCLHSHAEALRVRGQAAGGSEELEAPAGGRAPGEGGRAASPPRRPGGFGAPVSGPPDPLPSFSSGEMCEL